MARCRFVVSLIPLLALNILRTSVVLLLCLMALPFMHAQDAAPGVASTFVPVPGVGHDYIKALSETVDPASGSVSLRISVPIPKSRGLTVPFNFAYDSNGVFVPFSLVGGPSYIGFAVGLMSGGGWSYTVPAVQDVLAHYTVALDNGRNVSCPYYTNFRFVDPNGGRHGLNLAVVPQCGTNPAYSYLSEGDITYRASLSLSGTLPGGLSVADPDGTTYSFSPSISAFTGSALASRIEDRNGNFVQIQDNGGGAFTETDSAGRTVLSSSGFDTSGNTLTVSGLGAPYSLNWESASYDLATDWTLFLDNAPPGNLCYAALQLPGSLAVVQSITIPNGEQYTFQYDPTYGLLSQITYPSGAWVKYTWGVNAQAATDDFPDSAGDPNSCVWRYGKVALASRTVSFDGVHTALSQTFQYSTTWATGNLGLTWTNKQTTVTTNDAVRGTSFTTTYVYNPALSGEPLPITSTTGASQIRPCLWSRPLLTKMSMDRPSRPKPNLGTTRSSFSGNRYPSTTARLQ